MRRHRVPAQGVFGGQPEAAHGADGVAAVPGEVLTAPRAGGQQFAAARHRTHPATTCSRDNRPGSAGPPHPTYRWI